MPPIAQRDGPATVSATMDVRQLAALVAIADHGTFSAAARALFTVQSNVSSHIARLEKELGHDARRPGPRRADRRRRAGGRAGPPDPARAGRHRRRHGPARRRRHRRRAHRDPRHDRPVAAPPPALRARGPPSPACGRSSPRAARRCSSRRCCRASTTPRSSTCPSTTPSSTIEPLFAEDLAARRSGRITRSAVADEISLAELAAHRLLLPPPGSALRRVLDRAAGSVGVQLEAQAEIDGVRLLATLAVDGHGAAIVPATAVPQTAARRHPACTVPELPPRVVALAYHRRPAAERRRQGPVRRPARVLPARAPSSRASASAPTPSAPPQR